jgi:hypothetical protein
MIRAIGPYSWQGNGALRRENDGHTHLAREFFDRIMRALVI